MKLCTDPANDSEQCFANLQDLNEKISSAESSISDDKLFEGDRFDEKGVLDSDETNNAQRAADKAKQDLDALYLACTKQASATSGLEQSDGWFQKWGGATIVGAGTALAGGLTAYHIVQDAHNAKLDKAEQEAYQEFMDNLGSKIRCFIGADEIGMYGDMISTQLSE